MFRSKTHRPGTIHIPLTHLMLAVLLASSVASLPRDVARAEEAPECSGLANRGFESGSLDCWTAVAADGVVVLEGDVASLAGPVAPSHGEWFARLGSPKEESQNQPRGLNRIEQSFTLPDEPTAVTFDVHVFSWEHRADRVSISLTLPDAVQPSPIGVDLLSFDGDCPSTGASNWTCELDVTGDKSVLLDDTGTVTVALPAGVGDATISFAVEGTSDNAFATWMYVDANSEPVAEGAPEVAAGATLYEGAPVRLLDSSSDPDGDEIVAWEWTVTGPDGYSRTADVPSPWFVPPDDGAYRADLKVTDTSGATDRAGFPLDVANAPPLVNALDVEVADAGDRTPVRARYLDAGWIDEHTAEVIGASAELTVEGDHVAGLGVGRVTGDVESASPLTLEVTDDGQDSGRDDISVEVNAPGADRGEMAEPGAVVHAGTSYVEYLSTGDDTDRRRVVLPTPERTDLRDSGPEAVYRELPVGTEVLVSLTDLPADYDVAVVTSRDPATAPFSLSPFSLSPFSLSPFSLSPFSLSDTATAPFSLSPIERAPFSLSPFSLSPFSLSGSGDPYDQIDQTLASAPFSLSPFSLSPFSLSPFSLSPLSDQGMDAGASTLGGSDVSPSELGIELLDGEQLAGFSVSRGTGDESVLVRVVEPGTTVTVIVWSPSGIVEPDAPYRLDVEAAVPYSEVATLVGAGAACPPRTDVTPDGSTEPTLHGSGTTTLFVTSWDRLADTTGADSAELATLQSRLAELADRPEVGGRILSLPASVYADWNENPCSVTEANRVTDEIREAVQTELADTGYQNVVLVGSDDVIPHRRVPGETDIGGERTYLSSSFLEPGTPLYASMLANANLTDDYYVDEQPTPFQGRALFVPDLPISRLVETPTQITGIVDAYVAADGRLIGETATVDTLALGHDFLWDGTERAAAALSSVPGTHVENIAEGASWTAADLRRGWLGIEDSSDPLNVAVGAPEATVIGSHWTHFATQSAAGFNDGGTGDIVSTTDVVSPLARDHRGTMTFTVGCHAGLNVPNGATTPAATGLLDPALDFPEAVSGIRTGVFVASTGYGLGETEGVAGTELLMALLAEELLLAPEDRTVGDAVVAAKRRYVAEQSAFSVYDEKSLIQTVLYGLPTFSVHAANTAAAPSARTAAETGDSNAADFGTLTFGFDEETVRNGTYWSIHGRTENVPGRPIQPLATYPLDVAAAGVLVTGGAYHEVVDVDPVISRPTMEWEREVTEPDRCLDGTWWPTVPASLQRVDEDDQTLVVVPGQFRCEDETGTSGTQRLFDSLAVDVLPTVPGDTTPPQVTGVDLRTSGGDLTATVSVVDPDDLDRVVAVALYDGLVVSHESAAGSATVELSGVPPHAELFFQVVDPANNVTVITAKGALLQSLDVTATEVDGDGYFRDGVAETFAVTADGPDLAHPLTYAWSFGDGTGTAGVVPEGGQLPQVSHTYGPTAPDEVMVTVRVSDSAGATGTADLVLRRACDEIGDAPTTGGRGDLVTCASSTTRSNVTLSVGTVGPLATQDFQYRFLVDRDGDGSTDAKLTYNDGRLTGIKRASASIEGRTLTVSFPVRSLTISPGDTLSWSAEVWGGVPGEQSAGFVDRLPDEPSWRQLSIPE